MTLSTNGAARRPSVRTRSNESGYVIAQTALLLVPLLIFAAFATDIGAWYVQSQKIQRAADASALAGVAMMPDLAQAEQVARETALLNGYTDATPNNNNDFDSGPAPQIRVTAPNSYSLEVEIRSTEDVYFSKLVMDDITLTRYSISQFVKPVYMGNPTSGLGTGEIPPGTLGPGMSNDQMWLSINGYCTDREHGDMYLSGFYNGTNPGQNTWNGTCGTKTVVPNWEWWSNVGYDYTTNSGANPTFPTTGTPGYVFVAEYAPSSPAIDLDVYDPGMKCPGAITKEEPTSNTSHPAWSRIAGTPLYYEVYGPSQSLDHQGFIASNAPISSGNFALDDCFANSPAGDNWHPIPGAQSLATPGANGGYYYVRISNRNPSNSTPAQWGGDVGINNFSMRATKSSTSNLCIFGAADTTCPQLYALEHLPLYRNVDNGNSRFYLANIDQTHAGETLLVTFFDAAEGIDNIQFADPFEVAVPFEWKYADQSIGGMPLGAPYPYSETNFAAPAGPGCTWTDPITGAFSSGNVCLNTSSRPAFNDRIVQIKIEIPDNYTCNAGNCWWSVRYNTGANATDRSNWSLRLLGDPVRIIE